MKVAKIAKNKKETNVIEMDETYSIGSMLKIIIILLVIFGVFYAITTIFINNRQQEVEDSLEIVDSSKITLNQLLNRPEDEYYVMATKPSMYESSYIETNYAEIYNNYINEYKKSEDALKFYYVDLDSALNKKYFANELNITDQIQDLKLNDEVLFKISSGKIDKAYVGKQEIIDKLSRL